MSLSFQTMAAWRYGYGFRPGETPPADKHSLLEQIRIGAARPALFPLGGIDARRTLIGEVAERLRDNRMDNADKNGGNRKQPLDQPHRDIQRAIFGAMNQSYRLDGDARIAQAIFSPNGFHERLAVFWSNHFAVSVQKGPQMRLIVPLFEAEAIRPNVGAKFATLLRAVTRHPAMLIYLDQAQSIGPESVAGIRQKKGLNENLARELLELHTLGAGSGYTQDDVRSAAMVLTGVTVDRQAVDADFKPTIAEPGSHNVMGVSYGGQTRAERDYLSMLDDLAVHPKTAQHICRKLAIHFLSDTPDQAAIDAMAGEWLKTGGDLMAVYQAMLDQPAAFANEGAKARAPFDFIVSGLRAFDLQINDEAGKPMVWNNGEPQNDDDDEVLANNPTDMTARKQKQMVIDETMYVPRGLGFVALRRMGQTIWQPASPAGFPGNFDAWINASALAERIAWSHRAIARYGKQDDPRQFLKDTMADAAREDTIRVVGQAPNKATGLTLVLASPEFNRR